MGIRAVWEQSERIENNDRGDYYQFDKNSLWNLKIIQVHQTTSQIEIKI